VTLKSNSENVLARLGDLRITPFEADRVRRSRDYRMHTAAWILAPWEIRPSAPSKRAG
jgi:hypothetical protein